MSPRVPRHRSAGYTLLEMLMVVLVLGIASALAAPMLGQTDTTRLAEAAKLIEADLAYAQVESITHTGDPRVVVFDTGAATPGYFLAAASSINASGGLKTGKSSIANPVGGGSFRTTFGKGRATALGNVRLHSVTPSAIVRFGVYGQVCTAASTSANHGTDTVITLKCNAQTVTLTVDDVTGDVTISEVF